MQITKPEQIDGKVALALRKSMGESQTEFWGRVGVAYKTGSTYETGRFGVPRPVRILLFLRCVAKVPLDADLGTLSMLASSAVNVKQVKALLNAVANNAQGVCREVDRAMEALSALQ